MGSYGENHRKIMMSKKTEYDEGTIMENNQGDYDDYDVDHFDDEGKDRDDDN